MTRYDLEIIWRLRKKFSLLEEELKALREAAENISPVIDGLPKSKNATSKVENLSVKILDIEEKFAETAEKLIEMTGEFSKFFERELPDEIACIFILRYVACRTWREIAQGYRRTLKWSYSAHAKGLKILEKVQFFAQD